MVADSRYMEQERAVSAMGASVPDQLRQALADDLSALIRLHDRELDATCIIALKDVGFPLCLSLQPDTSDEEAQAAFSELAAATHALDESISTDDLAADYAALYLNNRFNTSACESVWLDEDHLVCQQPMFELRQHYELAGLAVADWRKRADDHFVVQLHFLLHQLTHPGADLSQLAGFMDEHIGYWFAGWADRVRQFATTDFYAGLASLTHLWLTQFRAILADHYDQPVPSHEEMTQKIRRKLGQDKKAEAACAASMQFMPGSAGPSW